MTQKKRKIIQIAALDTSNLNLIGAILLLCDDGTLWSGSVYGKWRQVDTSIVEGAPPE